MLDRVLDGAQIISLFVEDKINIKGGKCQAVPLKPRYDGAELCNGTQTLSKKGESGDVYLAHLEQMLSVTLACGSG